MNPSKRPLWMPLREPWPMQTTKNYMYMLMHNFVVEVVKGGRIQALIGILAARAVTQE